jgi:hypothetical protein
VKESAEVVQREGGNSQEEEEEGLFLCRVAAAVASATNPLE